MRATDDAAMFVTSAVAIIRDARAHLRPVAVSRFSATDRRSDSREESGNYSDTTLSAAAVFSAKIFGVMNWAFLLLRSTSVTPRATEHFPQTKIGTL